MKSIDRLVAEHDIIERALSVLEKVVAQIESGQSVVLLTGATGYVGGSLLTLLETKAQALRCLARKPERLLPRVAASTEVVQGDMLEQCVRLRLG